MNWSFSNDLPIYTQLIEQIKAGIVTGEFPPGERLPSVRDLAAEAGVNPNTMQRALAQLESDGLVYSQRTAGRFVTQDSACIDQTRHALAQQHMLAFLQAMRRLCLSHEETLSMLQSLMESNSGKENQSDECPDMP